MTPDAWLEARLVDAPLALRETLSGTAVPGAARGAPRGGEVGHVGAVLRARAERLLAEAMPGPPSRETALTLLAADALMSLACEWLAEHDPGSLADLR